MKSNITLKIVTDKTTKVLQFKVKQQDEFIFGDGVEFHIIGRSISKNRLYLQLRNSYEQAVTILIDTLSKCGRVVDGCVQDINCNSTVKVI